MLRRVSVTCQFMSLQQSAACSAENDVETRGGERICQSSRLWMQLDMIFDSAEIT